MKPLNHLELENIYQSLKPLIGSSINGVMTNKDKYVFHLWTKDVQRWLLIDLNAIAPCVLPFEKPPYRWKHSKTSPLYLFLKAHCQNSELSAIRLDTDKGRVIEFEFKGERGSLTCQVNLFPHGQNMILTTLDKSISHLKIKELKTKPDHEYKPKYVRSLKELVFDWKKNKNSVKSMSQTEELVAEKALRQQMRKTQLALEKLKELEKNLVSPIWQELGEQLKTAQSFEITSAHRDWLDLRESFAWNLTHCFDRAKKERRKELGKKQRRIELVDQLAEYEAVEDALVWYKKNKWPHFKAKVTHNSSQRWVMDVNTVIYLGRSAKENIYLLRKAKPWHLWFHMKDYPSQYCIAQCERKKKWTEAELFRVSQWFLQQFIRRKKSLPTDISYDVIWAECRYIKPIKGDKLGRVTHHNTKTVRVKLD